MARRSTPTYSTASELDGGFTDSLSGAFATQDLASMKSTLDGINVSAEAVAQSLSKTFTSASQSGRAFNATLETIGMSLAKVMSRSLGSSLRDGLSSLVGDTFGGSGDAAVAPFADGGIVASPTFFGSGGSLGLMGERGAEAILPLSRGPNGQLGVAAQAAAPAPTINVSIATSDADSFRRSEMQVAGMIARAVQRGQRAL